MGTDTLGGVVVRLLEGVFRTMALGKGRLGVLLRVGARVRAGSLDGQFSPLGQGSLWKAVMWEWGGQVVLTGFYEAGVGEGQIKGGALGKVTRASGSSRGTCGWAWSDSPLEWAN